MFFKGENLVAEANKALISLIPKRKQPKMVGHFRPISLCSTHYKCVTKILTRRMRNMMDDLISPYQSSFVPGRHIRDNLVIGQEIMHIMKKAISKKGFMAMKIDLEQAYDCIW